MASNLSTIGFDDSNPDELEELLLKLAQEGRARVATPFGDYAIWRSRTGAEVWFHLAPVENDTGAVEREITGLTPFFEGSSEVSLNVTEVVKRCEDTVMEGAFHAWVAPSVESEGAYPIVFDAVDFAAVSHRTLPERRRARICGFAREVSAFADEPSFLSWQDEEPQMAPCSFIPVGLFAVSDNDAQGEGSSEPVPTSHALIIGKVLAFEKLVNEESSKPFYWISVESLAATYDVVASPEVVEGEIIVGGIVRAGCWLFGRAIT